MHKGLVNFLSFISPRAVDWYLYYLNKINGIFKINSKYLRSEKKRRLLLYYKIESRKMYGTHLFCG